MGPTMLAPSYYSIFLVCFYLFVAALCCAANEYSTRDVRFWNVFPAADGNVSVTRRKLSVPVVPTKLFSVALVWMIGVEANTELVVPPQVYVNGAVVDNDGVCDHATEHLSIAICKPFVVSVSKSELAHVPTQADAFVVSLNGVVGSRQTPVPVFLTFTER